jgi:hypothetical protein
MDGPTPAFDDQGDPAMEAAADAAALAEIESGKGVPNDRVLLWLKQLANGVKLPLPTA